MYELKKKWEVIYKQIRWDRALVLQKKDLPGRGLTKVEKHWFRELCRWKTLQKPQKCQFLIVNNKFIFCTFGSYNIFTGFN